MRKFWTLLTREVRSYFYSPIAYIVMIFFLIISGIDFYFQVSFMNQRQVQYTIQEAFFNSVFFWFAFVLIFPLITMRLFAEDPAHFYQAQSGWVSNTGAAPSHESGFVPVDATRDYRLAAGADSVQVPFLWHGPDGVSIRRTYTFHRGDYAVEVRDEVVNAGSQPWQGYVYR